eukprot:4360387-Prymnesium_polylepis.1
MISFAGQRGREAEEIMNFVKSTEWGLLLMDEVPAVPPPPFHVPPAPPSCGPKTSLTCRQHLPHMNMNLNMMPMRSSRATKHPPHVPPNTSLT